MALRLRLTRTPPPVGLKLEGTTEERADPNLRFDCGVPDPSRRHARRRKSPRCRLQTLGCFRALYSARHGQGYGVEELEGRLVLVYWRGHRLHQRDDNDLVDERLRLSHPHRRQANVPPLRRISAFL